MIEATVAAAIKTVAALSNRVYPLNAPEGVAMPYCVYVSSGTTEDDTLGGWIGSYDTTIEINLIHSTYKGVKELAQAVTAALKALNCAVHISENQPEIYEHEINAYRKIIEIKLQH